MGHGIDGNGAGALHSVDLPPRPRRSPSKRRGRGPSWSLPAGRESGWAVPPALRARWDLRIGDKARVLPLLAEELPALDLVLYDVPHDELDAGREFRRLGRLLAPGAVVISDHGPSGGLCAPLATWARRAGTVPHRRSGLGLYGFHVPLGARLRGSTGTALAVPAA